MGVGPGHLRSSKSGFVFKNLWYSECMLVKTNLAKRFFVAGAAAAAIAAGSLGVGTAIATADPVTACVDVNDPSCATAGDGAASANVPGAGVQAGPDGAGAVVPGAGVQTSPGGASAYVPGGSAEAGPGGASFCVPNFCASAG